MIVKCNECGCPFDSTETSVCPECGCPMNDNINETIGHKCAKCNSIVDSEAKFCKICGFPNPISTSPIVNIPPIANPPKIKSQNNFWSNKNNIIYLSLGVIVLIIAITLAVYFRITKMAQTTYAPEIVENTTPNEVAPTQSSFKYVIAERMWFRTSPQISTNNQIELLYYGAPFEVISYDGNWAYINANGRYGYVNSDFIVSENDFIRFNSLISQSSRGDMMAAGRRALISYSQQGSKYGGYDTRAIDLFPNESNCLQCSGYKETTFATGETVILLKMLRTDNSSRWITAYKIYQSGSFEHIGDYIWVSNPTVYKSGNNYHIK